MALSRNKGARYEFEVKLKQLFLEVIVMSKVLAHAVNVGY